MGLHEDAPFRDAPESFTAKQKEKKKLVLDDCDQLIVRDWQGLPYIPGSSLKGVVRHFLERDADSTNLNWLLGEAPHGSVEDVADQGTGGAAIFEDAFVDVTPCALHDDAQLARLHAQWFHALRDGPPGSLMPQFLIDYARTAITPTDSFAAHSWRLAHESTSLLSDARHLPYWKPADLTYVEQQVGIDRRTGAAAEGKLFSSEVVPAGLPFHLRLLVTQNKGKPEQAIKGVELLLRALAGFNLDPVCDPIQLGSGANHGWGRMACLFPTVRVTRWTPSDRCDLTAQELPVQKHLRRGLDHPPRPRKTRVQIQLDLCFDGPLLVNDPGKACAIEAVEQEVIRSGEEGNKSLPDHVPRTAAVRLVPPVGQAGGGDHRPGQLWCAPLLPATGFKGAMRSQLERILRTVHPSGSKSRAKPVASQLERILRTIHPSITVSPHGELMPVTKDSPLFVRELLGFQDHESGLWCSEFVGYTEYELSRSKRELVAIDRFTGGAAAHAKFDAFCFDRPRLHGALVVALPSEEQAARQTVGAVALLLRDLIEGDVAFGFGDTKSFGQCRAQLIALTIGHRKDCPLAARLGELSKEGVINYRGWQQDQLAEADKLLNECLNAVRPESVS